RHRRQGKRRSECSHEHHGPDRRHSESDRARRAGRAFRELEPAALRDGGPLCLLECVLALRRPAPALRVNQGASTAPRVQRTYYTFYGIRGFADYTDGRNETTYLNEPLRAVPRAWE